jgi:hypothetical protein
MFGFDAKKAKEEKEAQAREQEEMLLRETAIRRLHGDKDYQKYVLEYIDNLIIKLSDITLMPIDENFKDEAMARKVAVQNLREIRSNL